MRLTKRLVLVWAIAHVLGCGGGAASSATRDRLTSLVARGRYQDAVTSARKNSQDRALAEIVIELELRSPDAERSQRAWSELQLVGSRARPLLDRLEGSGHPLLRARALSVAMGLGDQSAREALRALADDPDPEVRALALLALDPERDESRLTAALSGPQAAQRLAAVRVLVRASAPKPELRLALEAALRVDPDPFVRANAAAALTKQGHAAAPALERALGDEDQSVRLSAIAALGRVGGPAELARLGHDLGNAANPETLAAAVAVLRALAAESSPEPSDLPRAAALFERALAASEPDVRARAAVLCRDLPRGALRERPVCNPEVLRARLAVEPRSEIKLLLSLALGADDAQAQSALSALARDGSSASAVEAAAELATHGDVAARSLLTAALKDTRPNVRVSALRALASLEGCPDLTPWLADGNSQVRTAAAGAILATG